MPYQRGFYYFGNNHSDSLMSLAMIAKLQYFVHIAKINLPGIFTCTYLVSAVPHVMTKVMIHFLMQCLYQSEHSLVYWSFSILKYVFEMVLNFQFTFPQGVCIFSLIWMGFSLTVYCIRPNWMQIHHLSGCPFVGLASCFDTGTGFLYGPLVLLQPNPDYQHFYSNWSLLCPNGMFTPKVCCGLCVVALVTRLILLNTFLSIIMIIRMFCSVTAFICVTLC